MKGDIDTLLQVSNTVDITTACEYWVSMYYHVHMFDFVYMVYVYTYKLLHDVNFGVDNILLITCTTPSVLLLL